MHNIPKYIIGLIIVIGIRLLPHPPNIEPITATLMPYAKRWGMLGGAMFGFLAIISYDVLTHSLGPWTFFTAGSFVALGIAAGWYFARAKKHSRMQYVVFAVIATLVYDALTGLTVGPLFFGQSFTAALAGQIPFTLAHLSGNVLFAAVLSPLIEKWVVHNESLNWNLQRKVV